MSIVIAITLAIVARALAELAVRMNMHPSLRKVHSQYIKENPIKCLFMLCLDITAAYFATKLYLAFLIVEILIRVVFSRFTSKILFAFDTFNSPPQFSLDSIPYAKSYKFR